MEISRNMQKSQPIIITIWGIGKQNDFRHAVVIFRDNEQPEHLLGIKDPAAPDKILTANLKDLMTGNWQPYAEFPGFHCFARSFFYTKHPAIPRGIEGFITGGTYAA
jgi:hypothetical protein